MKELTFLEKGSERVYCAVERTLLVCGLGARCET